MGHPVQRRYAKMWATRRNPDPVGVASSGTGLGLAIADASLGGTKAIPVVGNVVSVGAAAYDSYGAYKAYQACMAKPD
jgi:hypothetical protein